MRTVGTLALVPQNHEENNFGLGGWVRRQRASYKNGTLPKENVDALERLDDWAWNVVEVKWIQGFRHLGQYVNRETHARVPVSHEENGFKLGAWVRSQRSQRDRLSIRQKGSLEKLPGWLWDFREYQWETGHSCLLRFVARTGHARVSRNHIEYDFKLGQWVTEQRQAYRRGKMSYDRRHLLEKLPGWTWSLRKYPF